MDSNTRFNQRIIEDIEGHLLNIDRQLKALSPEDQKKLINEERNNLMSLARNALANRGKIDRREQSDNDGYIDRGIGALSDMFDWIASKLVKFLGFDPFKWLCFEECNHNTSFANRAFSNPCLIDALEQAGQILMEKQSPHLKFVSRHFYQKVTSAADVEIVGRSITDFFRCLRSARDGYGLHINVNDVNQLFINTIQVLLQYEITQDRFERLHSNPLVLESGELCWVKYEFVSNTFIESGYICDEKRVDMNVTIWYYWFPSESDFRQALRRVEQPELENTNE